MNILKYIILAIVNGIVNTYPISYNAHLYLYQNLFNTTIFNDKILTSILNLSILISIIIIYRNDIISFIFNTSKHIVKKEKNKSKKAFKFIKLILITSILNIIIYFLIPHKIKSIKSLAYFFIISALIFFITTNKKGTKKNDEITYIDSIIIGLSSILTFIPTISILGTNLLACSKQKIKKKTSLRYSLTCFCPILLLESVPGIIGICTNPTYLLPSIISIFISLFISLNIYKSLKYIYYTNKFYRLSIYCIITSIFIFYWFN